jgi:serine protease Do
MASHTPTGTGYLGRPTPHELPVAGQAQAHAPLESFDLRSLAARLTQSTVKIRSGRGGSGAGVIWREDGRIVTNAHVASRSRVDVELSNGTVIVGEVTARDLSRDLAEISIESTDLPAIEFGDSDALRPGQIIASLGHPRGGSASMAVGVIHTIAPGDRAFRMVVADLRLDPGYSGGPMVDAEGRLIGINTLVTGGLGLAVPSNAIKAFLAAAERPRLGITLEPVRIARSASSLRALIVTSVAESSPAAAAGMLVGDILLQIDGVQVADADALTAELARAGNVLQVSILRGGSPLSVTVAFERTGEDGRTRTRKAA